MKYTIDEDNKTISVEGNPSLFLLVETLQKRFPNDEWKEYTLQSPITFVPGADNVPWTVTYCGNAENLAIVN